MWLEFTDVFFRCTLGNQCAGMKLNISSSFFNLVTIRKKLSSYISRPGTCASNKYFIVYKITKLCP